MGFLDFVVLAYITYGVIKGRRRGLVAELPSTVSLALFFLTGWGLFKIMYRGLAQASALAGQSVGILTFGGLVAASVALVRKMRSRLRWLAEKSADEHHQRIAGAIAGGVRAFLHASVVLLILAHWPLHFLTRPLAQGSLLGRGLVRFVLPVYDKTHGAL
jgi:uncharacterized membrane protein required for colicin V production